MLNATCKLCTEELALSDDTIMCELCREIEHVACHSYSGHEWEVIAAPGRAVLARHSAACVEAAIRELPCCGDDQAARDVAWQALEDDRYPCTCGELALSRTHR